jgi:hypothetical protein
MSNYCSDTQTICQRILSRIERGCENFAIVSNIIAQRMAVESKIAELLKSTIPANYDQTDAVSVALIEDLKTEVQQHVEFANELKTNVVEPANRYMQSMKEKQKALTGIFRKELEVVGKAMKETAGAQAALDGEKAKLNGLPQNKVDGQNQRIAKATTALQRKAAEEAAIGAKSHTETIPTVSVQFGEFDELRLTKLKTAAVAFENLKAQCNKNVNDSVQVFLGKMENFDGADRSKRYTKRIFDTQTKSLSEEEPDLMAVALADFRSEESRDLNFLRGDRIKVLVKHESGWWMGQLGEQKGLFPRSFVTLPGEMDGKSQQIGAVFLVAKDYKALKGGESDLLTGDLVYVDYLSKERCSGTNLRSKGRGYFPLASLEQKI